MARRKRGGHEEEHENHERWLISYADMITLLMVFFIVLFAMSTLDANKYQAIAESFKEAMGGGPRQVEPVSADAKPTQPSASPSPSPSSSSSAEKPEEKTPEQIAEELREAITRAGLERDVKVKTDERGVVLLLTNRLLFDTGEAVILPKGEEILARLTPMLKEKGKPLVVEGHTDDQPVSNDPYGNWPLSSFRATNVLRYLLDRGIDPAMLTSAGYADTKRICKDVNPSAQCREENRRVEIIVVVAPDSSRAAVGALS